LFNGGGTARVLAERVAEGAGCCAAAGDEAQHASAANSGSVDRNMGPTIAERR